nr:immunoglobulin heavy chain junction region [Macaca mulatta]MOY22264.1 immunoglobulin heavy chain junction region [Macaca mulatta]MOY24197.1 immunoglobulin heavy chain junction region [Macaca mulatta]MOY26235.1 immunoglobulin heavy chain junction region [Macaca mulatta]MOY26660.1 immunoglobulin heavy chain junction region [Macaca mulatta]
CAKDSYYYYTGTYYWGVYNSLDLW